VINGDNIAIVGAIGELKLNQYVHVCIWLISFGLSFVVMEIFICFSTGYGLGGLKDILYHLISLSRVNLFIVEFHAKSFNVRLDHDKIYDPYAR